MLLSSFSRKNYFMRLILLRNALNANIPHKNDSINGVALFWFFYISIFYNLSKCLRIYKFNSVFF